MHICVCVCVCTQVSTCLKEIWTERLCVQPVGGSDTASVSLSPPEPSVEVRHKERRGRGRGRAERDQVFVNQQRVKD